MEDSSPVCSDRNCKHPFKGAIRNAKTAYKGVMTSVSHKIQTVMCLAAFANPVCQEFLLDTGAGRNVISNKTMPEELRDYVTDAPGVRFATGGRVRPCDKAIALEGSLSGVNTFYALQDWPHALSVDIQVNEKIKDLFRLVSKSTTIPHQSRWYPGSYFPCT